MCGSGRRYINFRGIDSGRWLEGAGLSLSSGGGRFVLCRALVAASLLGANDHRPRLQELLQQIGMVATGAGLGHRPLPQAKVALRVARAAVEGLAAFRALFGDVAFLALRTLEAGNEILFDVFAVRVPGAGGEFPVPPVLHHQILAALGAGLLQLAVGLFLLGVQAAGGLTVGIAGAGPELTEAAALQHHGPAAVLAELLFFMLAGIG